MHVHKFNDTLLSPTRIQAVHTFLSCNWFLVNNMLFQNYYITYGECIFFFFLHSIKIRLVNHYIIKHVRYRTRTILNLKQRI